MAQVDAKAARRAAYDTGTSMLELSKVILDISEVQIVCRMLDYGDTPTFITHLQCLRASKKLETNVQFQAERANKRWIFTEIAPLMSQLHDPVVMNRLNISDNSVLNSASDDARRRASMFYDLLTCTGSERSWHLYTYAILGHEQLVGLVDSREKYAKECLRIVVETLEIVTEAKRIKSDLETPHSDRLELAYGIILIWA